MEHLNGDGLPEPIVQGVEVVVEIARKLTGRRPPPSCRQRIGLGVRKGTVYGKLTRDEIYDNIA
jgi:hypothetical protein